MINLVCAGEQGDEAKLRDNGNNGGLKACEAAPFGALLGHAPYKVRTPRTVM
jgi:hypothetical protein